MESAKKSFSLVVTALACSCVLASGCRKQAEERKNDENSVARNERAQANPGFSMTSAAYFSEFKSAKAAHREKYDGKLIELTGVINGVGRANGDTDFLSLQGNEPGGLGVRCFTKNQAPWKRALPGQTAKVVGKAENSISAAIYDAWILEVAGPEPLTLSAKDLANQYGTLREMHEFKSLILTGEVGTVEADKLIGSVFLHLKTDDKAPKVYCQFTPFAKNLVRDVKAGQAVRIMGEFVTHMLSRDGLGWTDDIGLMRCVMLDLK
ncbi:MAG: hypothetical protein HY040_17990 [Planctomycetes bacterium]|nr:hypothetical protein [Planctomycetota bacterium]